MMKKNTVMILLTAIFLPILLLSSCSKLPTYVMYTGGERGTYYNIGNSISALLEDNEDAKGEKDESKYRAQIQVKSSSGYKQNIDALVSGEASFAIVRNDIAYFALNGKGCYDGKAVKGFSAVAYLYEEAVYIIAREDVTDASMLSGSKIAVGEEGSANAIVASQLLNAMNVKDYKEVYATVKGAIQAYKNGEVDAMIIISGVPSSSVIDLAANEKFCILPVSDDAVERICEKYPYFAPCTVAKNNYSVLKEDLNTVSLYATLLAADSVDEDAVYGITKRIAEDTDLMRHKKAKEMLPERMWENCCIPLHDGANSYYKYYLKEQAKHTTSAETTLSPDETTENEPDKTT